MTSTNDVMTASLAFKRQIRDAYIDLRGMDARWEKIPDDVNRRDAYGDIIQVGFTPEVYDIKIVLESKELFTLQDTFYVNTSNTVGEANFSLKHYFGIVKYSVDIKKGDIIKIVFTQGSNIAVEDVRPFRVADVESKAYREPVSKRITITPYQ